MALYAGSIITSSDINALKNRVKAEMARRQYGSGSLAAYSGDFAVPNQTDTSNPGKKILIEHFNQTVGYIDKISPTGITGAKNGKINSIATANTLLRIYEQIDRYKHMWIEWLYQLYQHLWIKWMYQLYQYLWQKRMHRISKQLYLCKQKCIYT